jgi:Domain of unknown function (DUF4873)
MDDHADGYRGPAVLVVDGREIPVHVLLDARHEPHDGRLHWFGRMTLGNAATAEQEAALTAASADVALRTDGGSARARIGDVDPWGRYRVTGVGRPPFVRDTPDLDDD